MQRGRARGERLPHRRLSDSPSFRSANFRRAVLSILAGVALAVVPACDEDSEPPSCPDFAVGAIEGTVYGGAGPTSAIVIAGTSGYPSDTRNRLLVEADSLGRYRLELPVGVYDVTVYPPGSRPLAHLAVAERDTVSVGATVRRIDFHAGAVRVTLRMPTVLEGRSFQVALDGLRSAALDESVHEGRLEALLPLVAPGECRIALGNLWLPGVLDRDGGDILTVSIDSLTTYERSLLDYARMSGTIRGSWQQAGASRPSITAFSTDSAGVGYVTTTDAGSFTLDLFVAQPIRLWTRIGSIGRWIGGDSFETATVFDVAPGDDVGGIDVREGGIVCSFRGPGQRTDFHGRVLLRNEAGVDVTFESWGNPLVACNLAPGRYLLHFGHQCGEGWLEQWYDRAATPEGATPVEITAEGELVQIEARLEEGGAIEGRVLDADGSTGSSQVRLYDLESRRVCGDDGWTTAPFAFRGLPDGDYRLAALEGYDDRLWWYPGTENPDSATVLTINDHAKLTGIEWRFPSGRRADR